MNDNKRIVNLAFSAPARVEAGLPGAYRLARRNGELVLQGCFCWTCGREYGHEWRDVPTIELEAE